MTYLIELLSDCPIEFVRFVKWCFLQKQKQKTVSQYANTALDASELPVGPSIPDRFSSQQGLRTH